MFTTQEYLVFGWRHMKQLFTVPMINECNLFLCTFESQLFLLSHYSVSISLIGETSTFIRNKHRKSLPVVKQKYTCLQIFMIKNFTGHVCTVSVKSTFSSPDLY